MNAVAPMKKIFMNDEHLSRFNKSLVPVDRLLTDAVPCVLNSIEQKANGC